MPITFGGIKNVGYCHFQYPESMDYFDNEQILSVELTDDKTGNDLTEFKNLLKNSDLKNYLNPYNNNRFSIAIGENPDEFVHRTFAPDPRFEIYINDSTKHIEICDKNLKIISFLTKIFTRIEQMPKQKLIVSDEFKQSEESIKGFSIGDNLREISLNTNLTSDRNSFRNFTDKIYSPNEIKIGARKMNKILQSMMIDYFT